MYYIGIDIGTSSTKMTLIDEKGTIINEVSEEYQISEPQPGWKEIHPDVWMNAIENRMPQLLERCNSQEVGAIGVTGQMHTIILLDEHGNVIRPALMWNDIRTKDMMSTLKSKIREIPSISYISNIISTGSPAANLLWVKKHEPDNFKRIYKFLIGPDYIVYRLTNHYQSDFCEASTSSLYDLYEKKWSKDMQDLFDLPETIFPEIRGTQEVSGTLKKEWMDKFHLNENTKVIVGTGDNPAAAISTGCFSNHYPVLSIGTSGVLMYPKDTLDATSKGKNILFSFDASHISILVQGVVQSAGNSMAWWMKKILNTSDFQAETSNIDFDTFSKNKLIFYPHLSGDKTIYADPNLTGAFIGLQTSTTRKEMSIAVMEGIAMAVKQLCDVMHIPKNVLEGLRITGGGSKNDVWMQIISNVLNVKVQQLESGSGAGYGIALVAASVCEENLSLKDFIQTTIKIKKVFYPQKNYVELYENKYKKYLKIYDALQFIYRD